MSAPIVLVVDDNPTNLKLIAYLLQAKGYDVRTAGCDGYVPKPVDTRALPGIVAAHLARADAPVKT